MHTTTVTCDRCGKTVPADKWDGAEVQVQYRWRNATRCNRVAGPGEGRDRGRAMRNIQSFPNKQALHDYILILAEGACGDRIDEEYEADLVSVMGTECFRTFYLAVRNALIEPLCGDPGEHFRDALVWLDMWTDINQLVNYLWDAFFSPKARQKRKVN
ncbi:MAG: hypothetical protein GHCLOJNM_03033 [bacterium]|nr:hypothetical protein [bacterium]